MVQDYVKLCDESLQHTQIDQTNLHAVQILQSIVTRQGLELGDKWWLAKKPIKKQAFWMAANAPCYLFLHSTVLGYT